MPKAWNRTPDQEKYLNDLLEDFVQARNEHRIERFKNTLYDGWFNLWPEQKEVVGKDWKKGDPMTRDDMRALGAAIEKRKEQLYNYVRWHTNGKVIRSIRTSGVLKKFINKKKKAPKRSRKNQKLELYSKKYYGTQFKDQVEQEILDTTPPDESNTDLQKRKMSIYRKWRSLAWQMESDEVKAEIGTLWNEKNATNEVDGEDGDQDAEGELDPGETDHPNTGGYRGCINELGELLTSFLRELQDETGWAFTILGGGLNCEGEVKVVASHVGKTAAGNIFPQVCNGYQDNILQEFLTFVKVRHPIEERLLCAQASNERILKEASRTTADDKPEETSRHAETSRAAATEESGGTVVGSLSGETGTERDPTPSRTLSVPNSVNFSAQDALVNPSMQSYDAVSTSLLENGNFYSTSLQPLPSTNLTSPLEFTPSSAGGHSAPTASGPLFFPTDTSWMSYYNSPAVSTPMMQQATLPYDNLSPMSKFLVATAPNQEAAYNSSSASLIFFNPTDIASTTTSALMNTALINPATTDNTSVYLPIPSLSVLTPVPPYSDINSLACPSLDTPNSTLVSNYPGSLVLPSTEPEDRATTEITTVNNDKGIAGRKRARKDEVDLSFVLPEGATRAHKPRRLGDETCWEGVSKQSRRKKIT